MRRETAHREDRLRLRAQRRVRGCRVAGEVDPSLLISPLDPEPVSLTLEEPGRGHGLDDRMQRRPRFGSRSERRRNRHPHPRVSAPENRRAADGARDRTTGARLSRRDRLRLELVDRKDGRLRGQVAASKQGRQGTDQRPLLRSSHDLRVGVMGEPGDPPDEREEQKTENQEGRVSTHPPIIANAGGDGDLVEREAPASGPGY